MNGWPRQYFILSIIMILLSGCSMHPVTSLADNVTSLKENTSKIYKAVLDYDDYARGSCTPETTLVIIKQTMTPRFDDLAWTKKELPGLQMETFNDFNEKNSITNIIDSDLDLGCPYAVVAFNDLQGLDVSYFVSFSSIGFDPKRTQALIDFDVDCGGECGRGSTYLLTKNENGEWKVSSFFVNNYR